MLPAIFDILSYLCHQLSDRTLFIASVPLPFCARCAGLYTGMAITAIYVIAARRNLLLAPTLPAWLIVLAAIMFSLAEYALTWFLHLTEGLANFPRYSFSLITGAGVMLAFLGVVSLIQLPREEREERLRPFGVYNVLAIFLICIISMVLPLIQSGFAWWFLLAVYSIGTIAYFGALNYFPFAVGFRLLRYKPGRKVYLLVGLALVAMMLIEYLFIRIFYEEYSIVYQWLHGLLEL
jgi:uncharacterized membrane protein